MTTLYREIDALGGVFDPRDERALGRVEQLGTVLDILIKRGFTEKTDGHTKSVERLAYGYELMHRAICNMAGTSGAGPRWYMEIAQTVQRRVSPVFEITGDSNPHKPGDCLTGYERFLAAQPEHVTPPEAPKPPCYDRLVALVGLMAETGYDTGMVSEARAIMAELRPVDPDLIEARALAAQADCVPAWRDECLSGKHDEAMSVRARLQGIKRGRALAESGK